MKLIAESQYEDQVLIGLTALLCDLGINADGYTRNEALAVSFISPEDISLESKSIHMSFDDQLALIHSIEDSIRNAMVTAGYATIERAIRHAKGGKVHINRALAR